MKLSASLLVLAVAACNHDGPSDKPPVLQNKIVFISDRDGYPQLYVMNTDGTGVKLLPASEPGPVLSPAVSPDGRHIAFVLNGEIWLMNADATEHVNLTNNPAYDAFPSWSPDGQRLAFSSDRDGNNEIYVMNADGTNPVNLTNDPGNDIAFSWSPNGASIAFTADRDGNPEVYVMKSDGSDAVNLTNAPSSDEGAAWSHNGQLLAFVSNRDQVANRIYVMTSDGNTLTLNVPNAPLGSSPAWSPSDNRIAFQGGSEIMVMKPDGTGIVNLTQNAALDNSPSWSP